MSEWYVPKIEQTKQYLVNVTAAQIAMRGFDNPAASLRRENYFHLVLRMIRDIINARLCKVKTDTVNKEMSTVSHKKLQEKITTIFAIHGQEIEKRKTNRYGFDIPYAHMYNVYVK